MRTRVNASFIIGWDGESHRILTDGVVVYEGNNIVHVGKSYGGQADEVIDARGKMVVPGFINIHAHITQSPLSMGLKEDMPRNTRIPGSGTLSANPWKPDEWMGEAMAKSSVFELLRSGVTTLVELGAPDWLGYKESVDIIGGYGIRTYMSAGYRSGVRVDGELTHDNDMGFKQMENALRYQKELEGSHEDRMRFIMYPRTADLVSPELFEETMKVAEKLDIPVQTHAVQFYGELNDIKKLYGKDPITHLHDLGVLKPRTILGHTIYITSHQEIKETVDAPDLDLIALGGSSVAHCPWVFARVGRALESYSKYRDRGVNIGLGTDIFPQNMLSEIRLGAIISKVIDCDSVAGTAADLFNSATVYGANALGRKDLGRIAVGCKADLVFIDLDNIRMRPLRDPIRSLVYASTEEDVDRVVVDGRTLVENGKVLGMDEHEIAEDMQKIGDNYIAGIPGRNKEGKTAEEISPLSFEPL
jgi:cytosine/adenosine deaminase-related metal-dependent hydrolase